MAAIKDVLRPGSYLAYLGPREAECEEDIVLSPGDVVQVLEVIKKDDCIRVLVLRGARAGKVGDLHLDLSKRVIQGFRSMTITGSMASVVLATGSRRTSS